MLFVLVVAVFIVMVGRRNGTIPFVEYFLPFDVVPVPVLADEAILKDC